MIIIIIFLHLTSIALSFKAPLHIDPPNLTHRCYIPEVSTVIHREIYRQRVYLFNLMAPMIILQCLQGSLLVDLLPLGCTRRAIWVTLPRNKCVDQLVILIYHVTTPVTWAVILVGSVARRKKFLTEIQYHKTQFSAAPGYLVQPFRPLLSLRGLDGPQKLFCGQRMHEKNTSKSVLRTSTLPVRGHGLANSKEIAMIIPNPGSIYLGQPIHP